MTRVIAGVAGGKRLAVPGGSGTRPTSDRAREGLFGTVLSEFGSLAGLHAADLYAGSGAVGLEALSRGAQSVLLVESDARAVEVIRANIAAVGLPGARVRQERVERVLARPADARFDLVFADPPYPVSEAAVTEMLARLSGWLSPDALVVVERATRSGPFEWPPGYARGKSRRYGEATFWYGWYGTGAAADQADRADRAGQQDQAAREPTFDALPWAHEE
ncbi:16S rRNA (guanine(966)-N(2))-methyltransferase RsmD [Trebonia kvetii]|uniref:16S rRNA (Guanine(966)-N(2))-methyltransferase RsmD n=1 Tax=Trebonia kvetii TaxID=2480626 RepID=A0A6P2C4V7_9ACTN|nr:16S rRNA (guanine(966)-N(2))-methyltransferase RsmD [Trebonia kvetii]TVZ06459.1 16S rRNA (guanine(966)-N(2))-methyltransferase RsmD [Trebonia kvetii]